MHTVGGPSREPFPLPARRNTARSSEPEPHSATAAVKNAADRAAAREAIYGGRDPREAPLYTLGEAARYLHLSSATLATWVRGRRYPKVAGTGFSEPLIELPPAETTLLSFNNLVEAHVLRAIRTRHGVPMAGVRSALDYARETLGIARLFLSRELMTVADDPDPRAAKAWEPCSSKRWARSRTSRPGASS
jgi:hypothetical protein